MVRKLTPAGWMRLSADEKEATEAWLSRRNIVLNDVLVAEEIDAIQVRLELMKKNEYGKPYTDGEGIARDVVTFADLGDPWEWWCDDVSDAHPQRQEAP